MTLTKSQKSRRKQADNAIQQVSGHGNYYTEKVKPFLAKNLPTGTFKAMMSGAGTGLGSFSGIPGGAAVGGYGGAKLGNALSRVLGFGDYEVRSNTISKIGKAVSAGELVPDFGVRGNATRVRHREFIKDILVPASPLAFTNEGFALNPGNSLLFPWLAPLAAQYQQYRFEGLLFEFKTLSSEVATGGPMGAVILATNYDVLEDTYLDKVKMENSQYAVSAKPSMSQFHTVECDPDQTGQKLYYVRDATSSLAPSQDARFADLGKFQIATAGLPGTAGQVLGELWVSYDVVFYKPELGFQFSIGTKVTSNTAVSKTVPYGTNPLIVGDTRVIVGGNSLTAVVLGDSLIVVAIAGTVLLAPVITASTATVTLLESAINSAATQFVGVYRVSVTASAQTFVTDVSLSGSVAAMVTRITNYAFSLA